MELRIVFTLSKKVQLIIILTLLHVSEYRLVRLLLFCCIFVYMAELHPTYTATDVRVLHGLPWLSSCLLQSLVGLFHCYSWVYFR